MEVKNTVNTIAIKQNKTKQKQTNRQTNKQKQKQKRTNNNSNKHKTKKKTNKQTNKQKQNKWVSQTFIVSGLELTHKMRQYVMR